MSTSLLIMGIGGQELIVIVVILLLLFGGKKIPELMRGLGKGVKEFKEGQKDESSPEKKSEIEDNK
ncbi:MULTISPECIES: twin-arginine translocase TatA/TatE family subunit [Sphingobacterium]|jgi:sec-independent protein translocase protein TatA|uniref:Sec-independent protein translocase protein TatA n=3 Tax=Sphingobacterium TaxID=28453 RepID=A0A420G4R8_9SPHI|nr:MULTISPECIES: twin-arginine translocase TatA/TatE family subunit [Sphingobacterium]MBB1647639.1 preprotein translocase [Sphingobacterium sp. UME9]MCS4167060.1 sec-independent protein translocase protein TatA [Sphingobacterium sp. BIGb0116]QMV70592.1 twin-arginine translocase TatA/TatE family subunit [Sphingobacterium paramultivorum]QQT30049.1 twin-arginine translocase TatA/TatE family subunit [Sphingobacterium multivorum]QQT53982.1 twin-arginine translocase TatA/TatE family subunit [Sphingo